MDKKRFTNNMLGHLVEIRDPRPDIAFVPAPLPQLWKMPEELWPLLVQARESLARLDGVGRHLPNHQLLLVPLQQREALRSSSMEGTYATPEELLLYQIDPRDPSSDQDRVNAWREVLNYGKALQLGVNLLSGGLPLSLRLIREMHRALLQGVRGQQRRPGEFRDCQVHVVAGARFVPAPTTAIRWSGCIREIPPRSIRHRPADTCLHGPLPVRDYSPVSRWQRPRRPSAPLADYLYLAGTVQPVALHERFLRAQQG